MEPLHTHIHASTQLSSIIESDQPAIMSRLNLCKRLNINN